MSHYIDNDFYENLLAELKIFDDNFLTATPEQKAQAEQVLFQEARLIDELRLEEWLDMYTKKCLYWVPTVPGGGNPKKKYLSLSMIVGVWKTEFIDCVPVMLIRNSHYREHGV